MSQAVRLTVTDGIAQLILDDPDHSANTMNEAYRSGMELAVGELAELIAADPAAIAGVVVSSTKKSFFAGGDLAMLQAVTPQTAGLMFDQLEAVKATLRRLETIGKPVVAAINGAVLGGGLEIALATHHRIAARGRYDIGLPEVTLGLLPGGGGVTRTVRMFGLAKALTEILLEGKRFRPDQALAVGLVDDVVEPAELLQAAIDWIRAKVDDPDAATQPWDRKGYRMPGGTPKTPALAAQLPAFTSMLHAKLKGADIKAPAALLAAAVEGAAVDFATASRIESRWFTGLAAGQQSTNMIQAFYFDLQAIGRGTSRPQGIPPRPVTRVGVVGAGMMGSGIAHLSAKAGIDVVLADRELAAAERGKAATEKLLTAAVQRGRSTPEQAAGLLGRIQPTGDFADLADCDLIVEAVFESVELKHQVLAQVEAIVGPDTVLGTNTSTLPITTLATGVQRQSDVIGIHFFSPVERMNLVEIIVGRQTSDETLARAFDYVAQLRRTPIVVNDSRGFFTSRVFGTLVLEAAAMVGEGVDPQLIERAAHQAGFPGQPLAMLDEVSLTLPLEIEREAARLEAEAGRVLAPSPAMVVLEELIAAGRPGRAGGAGFYDYTDSGKQLWPQLWERFVRPEVSVPLRDVKERFLFAMSLESVRILDEGVLRSIPDANIGSIFGIGFPPATGGVLQFVNGYEGADGAVGPAAYVARADELAARYGSRFVAPESVRILAAEGRLLT